MKSWLFTLYSRRTAQGREQVLSIFLAYPGTRQEELDAGLAARLQGVGPINSVHVVGYPSEIAVLRDWLDQPSGVLLQRLTRVLGGTNDAIAFVSFDVVLGRHTCTDRLGNPSANQSLLDQERHCSLIKVFLDAGGEERAPIGTHYAKTSDKHCDRFLRVSNVLESEQVVRLVAFWLMPSIWKISSRNVVVDTSGIYSVALTALREAARLGGLAHQPLVWSHRSHEGIDDIPKHVATDAVFVVSASTSNGLIERLMKRGARARLTTTLFSLAQNQIDGHVVLCNLRGDGDVGVNPIENQDAANCLLCKQHFHLVPIRGDQFSIAPPLVTSVEIRGTDLQPNVRGVLSSLCGLGAFFAYRRWDDDRLCSLGIDVMPIVSGPTHLKSRAFQQKLRDKWESLVRRSQTISLRNVVSGSYPGSVELAQPVFERAKQGLSDASDLQIVATAALPDLPAKPGTSTIVISACVDEGQELLSAARLLRDVQIGGTTSYLSVIQLMAPKQDIDRLKQNLTYGSHGPETFSYFSALDIMVDCYEEEPSWRAELAELQRLLSWADEQGVDVPKDLEVRIERLKDAPATGLADDLFWSDAHGHPLRLRSDFALIDDSLSDPTASQADLYAVFCVVLTALRHNPVSSRRLAHNAYERGVLSPSNFDRFNDGVLQACLLRAARPRELAYGACDGHHSEHMLAILKDALPNTTRPERSEALIEFVLALMTRRMTLARQDLLAYAEALMAATQDKWPLVALMGAYLKAKHR